MKTFIHTYGKLLHDVSRMHGYSLILGSREPLNQLLVRHPPVILHAESLFQVERVVQA